MTSKSERRWWLREVLEAENAMTMSEAAEKIEVSVGTLRRYVGAPGIKAPSKQYTRGGYKVYLYTEDDVAELRALFHRSLVTDRK